MMVLKSHPPAAASHRRLLLVQRWQIDNAVAHYVAIGQQIMGRHKPIAEMERQ
ncbi:MAG: hypothetical protein GPOALKHO_001348 [Sodalis sp.]|nr:MAG: hypothetical protein GPOALKHO_001348 [Sodalis sp.]